MAELGEVVSVADLGHENHSEDTCAFHNKKEPTDLENTFGDDADEDALEVPGLEEDGIAHKNSAAKLGSALKTDGQEQISGTVTIGGIDRALPVDSAAHHLIPGNASLKISEIKEFLHQDGMATGNIGYDINNHQNGSWLVGNYALRGKDGLAKWGPGGSGFALKYKKPPEDYAFAAIHKLGRQFHDAHVDYSDIVTQILDLLAKKMRKTKDLWCPEAKNQPDDPKKRQMFMLVARLNTVSLRMKTMLENPGPNWKANVYTSRFSKMYIDKHIYGGQ
jgi:hypothetical protein